MLKSTLTLILSLAAAVLAWRWFRHTSGSSETFRGKNVVICGGSTGIGEQIAYRFCEQGANVLVVARREWALRSVVQNCSHLGATSASLMAVDLHGGGIGNKQLLEVRTILLLFLSVYDRKLIKVFAFVRNCKPYWWKGGGNNARFIVIISLNNALFYKWHHDFSLYAVIFILYTMRGIHPQPGPAL